MTDKVALKISTPADRVDLQGHRADKARLLSDQAAYAAAFAKALPEIEAAAKGLEAAVQRSKKGFQPRDFKLASVTAATQRLEEVMKPLLATEAILLKQHANLAGKPAAEDSNSLSSLLRDRAAFSVYAESL